MIRLALTCICLALIASPAASQGRLCAARDDVVKQLATVHGEHPQSMGLQRNARVMETFANLETGTWTVVVSLPSGISCLVAAGEAFRTFEAPKGDEEDS